MLRTSATAETGRAKAGSTAVQGAVDGSWRVCGADAEKRFPQLGVQEIHRLPHKACGDPCLRRNA